MLYSLAASMVGDSPEAEDVVADAFLRLWRNPDHDPSRGSVKAFLAVMVRSRALDRIRARKRRHKAEERGAALNPEGFSLPVSRVEPTDRTAEVGDARRRIQAALHQLSEQQRAVIDLAYFGGMSHSEIAAHLSEPLGTIKSRLRDGMRRLRDLLPLSSREAS